MIANRKQRVYLALASLLAFWFMTAGGIQPAFARQFTVTAGHSQILFDDQTATPVRWELCIADCAADDPRRAILFDSGDGAFELSGAAAAPGSIPVFNSVVTERDDAIEVEFSRGAERYRYTLVRNTAQLDIELPPGTILRIATGKSFIPEQLPGFGRIYSRVRPVQVSNAGQQNFDDMEQGSVDVQADQTHWTGIRNRYWTMLFQPQTAGTARVEATIADQPAIAFYNMNGTDTARFAVYAGPVEWRTLTAVAPDLSKMLFAALWDFLRMLCFGMLLLLELLHKFIGNYGVAIIMLSLSVKILMTPLTMLADRWQADVNRQHSLLKPELDHIRRNFKGEDAHRRVLDVYKRNGVSQFYTFKSAAGFLIQIPVFIAAFDMLAENIALHEVAFLWIQDLGKPDRLAELPYVVPFFGGWLNLLPVLMTGLSALAAWLQIDSTLSPDLQRQQTMRLYLMSAAFFILFYTFPAGMVLYWTSSNLFHLIKVESPRVISGWRRRNAH